MADVDHVKKLSGEFGIFFALTVVDMSNITILQTILYIIELLLIDR